MRKGRNNNKRGRRFRKRSNGVQMVPATLHNDVKLPRPLSLPLLRTMRIQFRNLVNLRSDGSGIINSFLSCDPSSTLQTAFGGSAQFPEWSQASALWGNVKVIQLEIRLSRIYMDETKGDVLNPLTFSGVTGVVGNPGSYTAVVDNGDSQQWSWITDFTGQGRFHAVRFTGLAWASILTPNPGGSNGMGVGCPGGIIFFANSQPVSTQIATCQIIGTYLLRSRI